MTTTSAPRTTTAPTTTAPTTTAPPAPASRQANPAGLPVPTPRGPMSEALLAALTGPGGDVAPLTAAVDRALALLGPAEGEGGRDDGRAPAPPVVVRPQNVFAPAPWHAHWDAARSLVNRALGGDWPGTLVLRRDALGPAGYATRVLFENRQLVRAVVARGGREHVARDLVVERRPASPGRFWAQRVRQAYDSQAQPGRMLAELAILPAVAGAATRSGHPVTVLAVAAAAGTALAAAGRARAGGAAFPATAPAWAPLWLAERAVCAWLALGLRVRGGVPYAGTRLRHAGLPLEARGAWCPW